MKRCDLFKWNSQNDLLCLMYLRTFWFASERHLWILIEKRRNALNISLRIFDWKCLGRRDNTEGMKGLDRCLAVCEKRRCNGHWRPHRPPRPLRFWTRFCHNTPNVFTLSRRHSPVASTRRHIEKRYSCYFGQLLFKCGNVEVMILTFNIIHVCLEETTIRWICQKFSLMASIWLNETDEWETDFKGLKWNLFILIISKSNNNNINNYYLY